MSKKSDGELREAWDHPIEALQGARDALPIISRSSVENAEVGSFME